jgi:hypothetical protein
MEDFFFSKHRILRLGPVRGVYFVTFAVFFILTEIGREVYRPFIYQNGIDDFGLADVVGNLLGTVAIIFFNLGFNHATRVQGRRIIAFTTVGVTLYELLQPILPKGVLDWKDVVSTPIAGCISYLIVSVLWRVVRDPLTPSEPTLEQQGRENDAQ